MPKKLVIANWKMKPETLEEADDILKAMDETLSDINFKKNKFTVVLCPPFVFLEEVSKSLSSLNYGHVVSLGAQDIASQDTGAFTGEVSGPMLRSLNTQYVIVGHSERRWKLGESDVKVNEKLQAVLRNQLTPIVCLGERNREGDFHSVLRKQINGTFFGIEPKLVRRCIIAYEPVWAISSNPGAKPDSPDEAILMSQFILGVLKELGGEDNIILYGGSITSKNAKEFLGKDEFSGVLVGGASVKKDEFVNILEIANTI